MWKAACGWERMGTLWLMIYDDYDNSWIAGIPDHLAADMRRTPQLVVPSRKQPPTRRNTGMFGLIGVNKRTAKTPRQEASTAHSDIMKRFELFRPSLSTTFSSFPARKVFSARRATTRREASERSCGSSGGPSRAWL
ncbi:uncharacterized protein PV07_12695 [Cladophialophora immunda]|uniref:Uncharacterized protein n=1 Tax=Cladophialophora immunda TaxID=569365 RepID=A0A0D2BS60_9EURO|nr:uncharacterized protein PV07_12695 [Cladophialophora immunda]KIW21893.1 hypothetical protein PV07_12695 [Cladophialophora immunda]